MTDKPEPDVTMHEIRQAIADLQARVDRLESIKADDLIAQHGPDANPDSYAAGYWLPHTSNECPVPEDRRGELLQVRLRGEASKGAKAAYEAWQADQVLTASKINTMNDAKRTASRPECPRHELRQAIANINARLDAKEQYDTPLLFGKSIIESMDMTAINKKLSDMMGDSAADDAKPARRKAKWGPWVKEYLAAQEITGKVQIEYDKDGTYRRHRVRLTD